MHWGFSCYHIGSSAWKVAVQGTNLSKCWSCQRQHFCYNCIFFVSSSSTDPQDSFGDFQILCLVGCGGSGGPRALAAFWWNGGLPPWTGGLSRGPGQLRPCIPATPLLPLGRRGCHTRGMAAFLSFVSSVSFTTCTPHSVGGTGYSVQVEMPYL